MLCFGRTEVVLIVARSLQGISAAVVWTVGTIQFLSNVYIGLALVVDTVGEARSGQAMAYVSSAMSIALILGPVLGGVVYARKGYYAAFGLAFTFIGFDLVLRVILVEKKVARRYATSSFITDTENPDSIKPEDPSSHPTAPSEPAERHLPLFAPTVSSAVASQERSRVPSVIRILKYPRLLAALLLSFVQALIISAFDATLPLYLNSLFRFTSFQAGTSLFFMNLTTLGLIYMAIALPVFFMSPIAGWLTDRLGPKLPAVGGLLFSAPFLILLRVPHASEDDQSRQVIVFCVVLALLGMNSTRQSNSRGFTYVCDTTLNVRNCTCCRTAWERELRTSLWVVQCCF
jgi:MFS family permease